MGIRIAGVVGLVALSLGGGVGGPRGGVQRRRNEVQEARALAEAETQGTAVSVRRVELNGTHILNGVPGGLEVRVRMPRGNRGWCCLIDAETLKLRRIYAIPNPPSRSSPQPRRPSR